MNSETRCGWTTTDPIYIRYHDLEWGVPEYDDRKLFEMLCLEGAQAGLSWITILKRREGYRQAFDNFDPTVMADYDAQKIEALGHDPRIIRNRAKINAFVQNARAYLNAVEKFPSFSAYLWDFVGGAPIRNCPATLSDIPAETDISRQMSKELKKQGFQFVGPTICYAFMQACGLVNDHTIDCFRSSCRT